MADGLAGAWSAATTVLAEGHRLLIADRHRFEAWTTIGVDDHV